MENILLEVIADTVESAIEAEEAGADRLEICANLLEGGTTPGIGLLRKIRENTEVPLFVMIRPRGGDFLYTKYELEVMKEEITAMNEVGIDGYVLGALKADGGIDVKKTEKLVLAAESKPVTFHRAFDLAKDPLRSLDEVIQSGASRILTSGQAVSAYEGMGLISELHCKAEGRIRIIPGGGINPRNVKEIIEHTGVGEVHMSAKKLTNSKMTYRKPSVQMGRVDIQDEYQRFIVDKEQVRMVKEILSKETVI